MGNVPSMATALFSSTQLRVLSLLFGQPDRSFFASEIIERVGAGSGAVQRQLRRLAESGLVRVFAVGRQTHYQANPDAPIFDELCAIMRKTVGLAEPLRDALEPLRDDLVLALVFGSVAKGTDTARSDIDLLLVSDTLTLEGVFRAIAPAEKRLGRPVQPTLYTGAEFERRRTSNAFLARVLAGDVIVLIGEIPDVDSSTG
jgi:predicted nucleotidyltransferase